MSKPIPMHEPKPKAYALAVLMLNPVRIAKPKHNPLPDPELRLQRNFGDLRPGLSLCVSIA